jgi:hypothetical protein
MKESMLSLTCIFKGNPIPSLTFPSKGAGKIMNLSAAI